MGHIRLRIFSFLLDSLSIPKEIRQFKNMNYNFEFSILIQWLPKVIHLAKTCNYDLVTNELSSFIVSAPAVAILRLFFAPNSFFVAAWGSNELTWARLAAALSTSSLQTQYWFFFLAVVFGVLDNCWKRPKLWIEIWIGN